MTEQELQYAVKVNDRDLADLIHRIDAVNVALGPETKQAVQVANEAIASHTQTVVAKSATRRATLRAELEDYKAIAIQAKAGSETQIAANIAAAKTARSLGLDVREAGLQYDHLGRHVNTLEKDVSRSSRGFLAGTGILGGLGRSAAYASTFFIGSAGLTMGVRSSWNELQTLNKEAALARQALKSTGGVAGESTKQIIAFADAEARKVPIDKASIEAAEVQLLRFTQVRNELGKGNDIYTQASHAVLDLAQKTGGDATSAALQLGKALNDPIRGLTSLRRVGVSFTQAQSDQIKALTQSGQILEAQKIILGQVEKAYGGAADAAGKTLGGQMTILKNEARDLGATFLTDLQPEIKGVVTDLQHWIDHMTGTADGQRKLKHDAHELATGLKDLVTIVKDVVTWSNDAAKAVGGWKNAFELLIALKLAGWASGIATSLQTLIGAEAAGSEAGLLGAKSAAGGLVTKLGLLAKFAGMVVAVDVIEHIITGNTKGPDGSTYPGVGGGLSGAIINTLHLRGLPGGVGKFFDPRYEPTRDWGGTINGWRLKPEYDPQSGAYKGYTGLPQNSGGSLALPPGGDPFLKNMVTQVAKQYGVPLDVALRQISQESGFNPNARSGAGALGIAQFMPSTGAGYGLSGSDFFNPAKELQAYGKMMSGLIKKYGGNVAEALSAYNSGNPLAYLDPKFAKGQTYNYVRGILGIGSGKSSRTYTPQNPNDFMKQGKVGSIPDALRYALSLAESTSGKADDVAAIRKILAYLRGQLASTKSLGKKADILNEINSYTGQLPGAKGKKARFASGASVKSFGDQLKTELKDLGVLAADGFAGVAGKARPKVEALQKLLSKPLTPKQLADAKVQLRELISTFDLKGLAKTAPQVAAGKKTGNALLAALGLLPVDLKIPIKDAWGDVVKTISPADLMAQVKLALAALGSAKTSSAAKSALAQLKQLGQEATSAVSIDKSAVAQAAKDALDAQNVIVTTAKSSFASAWSSMTSKAIAAFDQETQNALANMKVLVNGPFGSFLYGSGDQTPGNAAAGQLTAAHDAAAKAKGYAANQKDLADKQARVDQLVQAGFSENTNALRQARADLATSQQTSDDDAYQQKLDALNAQGALEQTAADKQLAQAQKDYQSQRDLQKEHIQTMLADLEKGLEDGTTSIGEAKTKLGKLWDQIGVDSGLAGTAMGSAFVTSLNESLNDPANGIWPTLDAVSKAISDLKQLKTLTTSANSGSTSGPQAGSGAIAIAGRPVLLADGGWVTHRRGGVAAVIGEGVVDEVVAPEPKLRQLLREELARAGGAGPQLNIDQYHAHDGTDVELLLGKLSMLYTRRPGA